MKQVIITIKGITYHTVYTIDKQGNVYNGKKKLKWCYNKAGYPTVNIFYKKATSHTIMVHRLVAFAFIPNIENKLEVNHKNGIKTDASVENLEWVTAKENTHHAIRTGLFKVKSGKDLIPLRVGFENHKKRIAELAKERLLGEKNHMAKLTYLKATEIRERYAKGDKIKDLKCFYNVGRFTIEDILYNRRFIDENYTPPIKLKKSFEIEQLKNGIVINSYENIKAASQQFLEINPNAHSAISAVCRNKSKTYKGYEWRYKKK